MRACAPQEINSPARRMLALSRYVRWQAALFMNENSGTATEPIKPQPLLLTIAKDGKEGPVRIKTKACCFSAIGSVESKRPIRQKQRRISCLASQF
jgi:hypothetical protein